MSKLFRAKAARKARDSGWQARIMVGHHVPPQKIRLILKSLAAPHQYYVGVTSDPRNRLAAHNDGLSPHTAEHRPWRMLVVIEFDEEEPATREFARRHFRQTSSHVPAPP